MFIQFSSEAQRILKRSKLEMQKLKHSFIGSEHVVLSILNNANSFLPKLLDYGLNYQMFYNELLNKVGMGKSNNNYYVYTPLLKRVLENAIIDVHEKGKECIEIEDIFLSIIDEGEGVANRILNSLGINLDNLYEDLNGYHHKKVSKKMLINELGVDLANKGNIQNPLIGRDDEVTRIMEILLRRNKNNPLLIGDAGVGKTAIVEEIAQRISKGSVPSKLLNYKIISLSTASLVAGTKYRGEFEERINKIISEIEDNSHIILFIDEIHTLIGAGGAEGAIDASNILKPALARGKIKVIGATTLNEYKEHISKDKAFVRRFQTVFIKENSLQETKDILYQIKSIYEEYHHVSLSKDILDNIVELSNKYIYDKKNPDKAIDILDMVCTKVNLLKNKKDEKIQRLKQELINIQSQKRCFIENNDFNKAYSFRDSEIKIENCLNKLSLGNKIIKKKVTLQNVLDVVENVSRVPIKNYQFKIKKLAGELKKNIYGQEEVVNKLVKVTIKRFSGLKNDLPYSILLTGSSGVGKTYIVKEYSRLLNIPLIRLDMSEYNESHTISKIIGSPPGYVGYNNHYSFLDKVRNNPFSIILLDEMEKACSEVMNLFLQIFDEGMITDSQGEKVYFQNTIIFMTSNIECHNNIGFTGKKNNSSVRNNLSTIMVNRINLVLDFNKLTKESIQKILLNRVKTMKSRYRELGYKVSFDEKRIMAIIDNCESEVYGVRHAIKMLEDEYDNLVFDTIIGQKNNVISK